MKNLLVLMLTLCPWRIRRRLLVSLLGYKIHPTAKIGLSIICPDHLEMGAGARIGSLTVCKGISLLRMGEQSRLGNLNWITGFPAANKTFFHDELDRRPELVIGDHAAVTNRHLIDCTNSVRIGRFTTFAGFRSQVLTHSIDLHRCRQSSFPIMIGDYCFVGTGCVLLGGSTLPDYSVLGAGSVLTQSHNETHRLYAGIPARVVKELPQDMAYFQRSVGFVY
jgi:carbonic anhydrase/acetyltransferase-like protein (isoleucine patch superfamily)